MKDFLVQSIRDGDHVLCLLSEALDTRHSICLPVYSLDPKDWLLQHGEGHAPNRENSTTTRKSRYPKILILKKDDFI